MKRLRSSDDVNSFEERDVYRDWGRRDDDSSLSRSSSHRSFHYKPENGRQGVSSSFSPRYDRIDDDHESPRFVRKRPNYDLENHERRLGHDRYRENNDRGNLSPSPRDGYAGDRIHRAESFSTPRREIPKGFRSERDRQRREGSVSSWQRFGMVKDIDGGASRWNKAELEEKGNMYFPQKNRESKSPACSKDSGSEQSKSIKMVDSRNGGASRWSKVGSEEKGNMSFPRKIRDSKSPACSRDSGSEQSKSTKVADSRNEQWKGTKTTDLGSEQMNSTKRKNPESDRLKSTKKKDLGSKQLKITKMKDFGSEQLKITKMNDFGSEQSKCSTIKHLGSEQSKSAKMKYSGSMQSKSSTFKHMGSEQSKSAKMKDSDSEQSKGSTIKDSGSQQLKIAKMKDSKSEQSKTTEMKVSGCELSKSTKMKDFGSEQLKSTKMKDLGSAQSKRTKMEDLGSEQLKSTKMTKTEEGFRVENGSTSEMEEGELENDPETKATEGNDILHNKLRIEELADYKMVEDKLRSVSSVELSKDGIGQEEQENGDQSLPEIMSNNDDVHEEKLKVESQRSTEDLVKAVDESAHSHENPLQCLPVSEHPAETIGEIKGSNNENKGDPVELMPMKEVPAEGKFVNHVTEIAESRFIEPYRSVCEGKDATEVALSERIYSISPSFKDKGKSIEISPPNATGSNHHLNFEPDDMDGHNIQGLDLFLNHPVKQPEKQQLYGFSKPKHEKLELEPFDLSLSLPNVLLPIDSQNKGPAPCSTSKARSIQYTPSSFWTNSDGFSLSMSVTGSQSVRHNQSCSLTNNSLENFEHSVSSRPLFGGKDKVSALTWQGPPSIEQSQKEVPAHQTLVSDGNGFLVHDQQLKAGEGSSKPFGIDRQLSLQRQLSTHSTQSARSHESRSEYSNDKKPVIREEVSAGGREREREITSSIFKSNARKGEQLVSGGVDSVEPIITVIVSEPVHVIAMKFNEMNEQAVVRLKKGVHDILVNANKQWQLSLFQKALNNRSEITLETLLKANRAQLEIMVALKTGVGEFLHRNPNISSSDMAEIYLNLRCRNLTCRNLLPVDECDCKVCSQKNGFCSNCMCLVCSKYDMASNTCSWVGCDVCLHWCHADCALRESYIRSGSHGFKEMQFHCVACDHPSEMFGFVKEVFQTFAKEWTGEKLSKELEYVRKIFSVSEDLRGKRLHEIALSMLSRLANKSDFREVRTFVMSFFAEISSFTSESPTVGSGNELLKKNPERKKKSASPSQEPAWVKPLSHEKAPQLEKASSFRSNHNDLQRSAPKERAFDELDTIVRMKEAEAKMFQTRADDARREAEGLKRIATAKKQRIEDEYTNRISKLRLPEAEEMRIKKMEELQSLERAHQEYLNMKMRITGDIRDLLSKMEATKRNFSL